MIFPDRFSSPPCICAHSCYAKIFTCSYVVDGYQTVDVPASPGLAAYMLTSHRSISRMCHYHIHASIHSCPHACVIYSMLPYRNIFWVFICFMDVFWTYIHTYISLVESVDSFICLFMCYVFERYGFDDPLRIPLCASAVKKKNSNSVLLQKRQHFLCFILQYLATFLLYV